MSLTDREKEQLKAMIDADKAKRRFHAPFVREEDWKAHKLGFGQLVTAGR